MKTAGSYTLQLISENRVWKITDLGQGFNFGPHTTSQNLAGGGGGGGEPHPGTSRIVESFCDSLCHTGGSLLSLLLHKACVL